jgi:hypothetical protein
MIRPKVDGGRSVGTSSRRIGSGDGRGKLRGALPGFSIEIDCPPGSPRPNDLFPGVLLGTGLKAGDFKNTSRFFGEYVWVLLPGDPKKDAKFTASKPLFKKRLTALHERGLVRFATW